MTVTRVQQGHRAFRAVLSALAHPGRWFPLPVDGADSGLDVLVDAVWGERPDRQRVMVVEGTSSAGGLLAAFRGTEERPEDGATVVYLPGPGAWSEVRLRGPGVDGHLDTLLPLAPAEVADRAQACGRWPLGVDLLFLDGRAGVAALPRTTSAQVL